MAGTLFGIPQNMIAGAGSQPNWGNWAQGPGQVPGNQQGGMATTQPVQNMPAKQYPGGGQMPSNPTTSPQTGMGTLSNGGQYQLGQMGGQQGMQSIMQMLMQHPAIQSMIRNMQGGGSMGGGQQQAGGMQGGGQIPGAGSPTAQWYNQNSPGGWAGMLQNQQNAANQMLNQAQQAPGSTGPMMGSAGPSTLGAAAQNPMQGYTGGGTGNLFGIPSNMIAGNNATQSGQPGSSPFWPGQNTQIAPGIYGG